MNKASREVQYPYAFDESDNLVFIEDIKKDTRHDHSYHCPNCGHSMLPRLGDHNAHCFAHSENQACEGESYIHKIAKIILVARFNDRSRPFTVRFKTKHVCRKKAVCKHFSQFMCEHKRMDEFDLHQEYDLPACEEVRLRCSSGEEFQPDVIIKSSKEKHAPIYLEVYHKHKCSPQKLESGQHIIEIRVKDWEELLNLDSLSFDESDRVSFYNFKDIRKKPNEIKKEAEMIAKENGILNLDYVLPFCFLSKDVQRNQLNTKRLILYPSGKTFCYGIFENEMDKHKSFALADITYDGTYVSKTFDPLIVLMSKYPKARRCMMCRHCLRNDYDNIWCELVKNGSKRKGTFDDNKGVSCPHFEMRYGQSENGLIEGVDYVIWINPKFILH